MNAPYIADQPFATRQHTQFLGNAVDNGQLGDFIKTYPETFIGVLPVTKGGTGLSTIAANRLLWSTATDVLSAISLGASLQVAALVLSVVDNTTTQKVKVSVDGTLVGTRQEINLIAGLGSDVSGVDNGGSDQVDVTVTVEEWIRTAATLYLQETFG